MSLNVGDMCNAQLGNPSDTSGYKDSTLVKVLAIQNGTYYLFQEVGSNLVGRAAVMYDRATDTYENKLYCTNARRVGVFGDLEECSRSLGFNLEAETA
jgi:hypothetical protein